MTDTDYSTEIAAVVAALNAVFENKEANKKNSLSGDYSSDTASYPTCQAVKGAYGTRVTSWQATPLDSNIPSELLVKTALDGKASSTHDHGEITNVGAVTTTVDMATSGTADKILIADASDSNKVKATSQVLVSQLKNTATLSNISSSTLSTQADINSALNTIIGTLKGTKFIEIVDTLPIPSADTMGKLYIISETESGVAKVNVYYTQQVGSGSSAVYAMVKMDANILDSLSWNDISDKPSFGTGHSNFAYGDHAHGEITTGGAVTTTVDMATSGTADKILIADASDSNKVKATSQVLVDQIKNTSPSIAGIGSNLNTQADVNSAIGSKFSNIVNPAQFVNEVSSLPTASHSTLGKLYAIPLASSAGTYDNYEIYVTVEHDGDTKTYNWEKLGGEAIREVKSFAGQLADAIDAINPSS